MSDSNSIWRVPRLLIQALSEDHKVCRRLHKAWCHCYISTTKEARCRAVSHTFSSLMQARSRRRVRSLRATVRSHVQNYRHLHAFHYRKRGCRVTVLSHFVGGAPLICAPWHRDVREWVTTSVTFPFSLAPSHHVSRANSKISTLTQRILSATDDMEAARNCLCMFFCL